MPIVTQCEVPGCETLTMGPLCLEHEQALHALTARPEGEADGPALDTLRKAWAFEAAAPALPEPARPRDPAVL